MSLVTVERSAGVVTFQVANPPLNILSIRVMGELAAALKAVQPSDRVIVIRGTGKHFSAGADIGEHMPEKGPEMIALLGTLFHALFDVPIPTVAVVRGACMGAGLELAAACDVIFAADEAKMGVPEITLGVFPPIGAVDLPARVGPVRAADLLYTGRTISGKLAAEWGLALESAPDAELDAKADAWIAKAAAQSGCALRACKRGIRGAASRPYKDALDNALGIYRNTILPSADGLEGLKSFIEKRKPVWQDR